MSKGLVIVKTLRKEDGLYLRQEDVIRFLTTFGLNLLDVNDPVTDVVASALSAAAEKIGSLNG